MHSSDIKDDKINELKGFTNRNYLRWNLKKK